MVKKKSYQFCGAHEWLKEIPTLTIFFQECPMYRRYFRTGQVGNITVAGKDYKIEDYLDEIIAVLQKLKFRCKL